MRIILCLLAFVTSPAWAEWVKVRETKDATFYIDPATIRKDGNLRKIWEVKDFRERDTGGEMSVRFLSEYDCREERYRVLALSSHTEPMAKGHTVISWDDPSPWVTIPLDTLGKATLKRVCAK